MKLILEHVKETNKSWVLEKKKEDGFNALHIACLNNSNDMVRLLLDATDHIDLNVKNLNNQTALHFAVDRLNYDIIKMIIDYDQSRRAGSLPLSSQCKTLDVNVQDKDGDTPLHCLLFNYTIYSLKQTKNTKLRQCQSNLMTNCAVSVVASPVAYESLDKKNYINIAHLLLDHGASLFIRNRKNQTPLELCNDECIIKHLLSYKL